MEYEFYIDLFFLTDFFLNFLSLFLAAAFLRERLRMRRLLSAAALGSLWNCLLIFFPVFPPFVELLLTVFLIGSLMVETSFSVAYGRRKWSKEQEDPWGRPRFEGLVKTCIRLFRADLVLLISSALLSGCLMFSRQHFYFTDLETLCFAGIVCLLGQNILKAALKTRGIGKVRYPVRLYYRGKEKGFLALADSGNRLRVPGSGKPVSLISYTDCKGFCDSVSGGFYVPYSAVGTKKGVLFAVLFEKMEILKDGTYITIENPAVAITREKISANGDFSILLPEEYVL